MDRDIVGSFVVDCFLEWWSAAENFGAGLPVASPPHTSYAAIAIRAGLCLGGVCSVLQHTTLTRQQRETRQWVGGMRQKDADVL
jgi:hypothetical protein